MKKTTKKDKRFIAANVPPELKLRLEEIAKQEDRSLSYIISKFLSQGVNTLT